MLDVKLLLLQQGATDALNVVEQGFSLDVTVEDWVVQFQGVKVLLTDRETCAFCVSLVDE